MTRLLRDLPMRSVLDVGCGTGDFLLSLRAGRPGVEELWGTDFAPELIRRVEARHPGIAFRVLDIERAALDRTFEVVVCSEVIEHLERRAAAFTHLARMVAPGGHLLVTCPTGKMYDTEKHFGHVHHPSPAELAGHAAAEGLAVVRLWNWGWPTFRLIKELVNLRPAWSLSTFAAGAYSSWQRAVGHVLYAASFACRTSAPGGCQLLMLCRRP